MSCHVTHDYSLSPLTPEVRTHARSPPRLDRTSPRPGRRGRRGSVTGRLADEGPADVGGRGARRPAAGPRAAARASVARFPDATPPARAPRRRARRRAGRRGRSSASGPTTATSRGPSASASATASAQPKARGHPGAARGGHREALLGRRPVPLEPGQRGVRQQGAARGRPARGVGVVGRVLRAPDGDQRGVRRVVGRVVEAARRRRRSARARCRAGRPPPRARRAPR